LEYASPDVESRHRNEASLAGCLALVAFVMAMACGAYALFYVHYYAFDPEPTEYRAEAEAQRLAQNPGAAARPTEGWAAAPYILVDLPSFYAAVTFVVVALAFEVAHRGRRRQRISCSPEDGLNNGHETQRCDDDSTLA
jgi:hypothetical protein